MYDIHSATLAYFKTRPLMSCTSHAKVPTPTMVNRINIYMKNNKNQMENIEESALKFYLLNHAFSLLLQKYDVDEILTDKELKIAQLYHQHASEITQRCLYYVLLIITRESRHTKKTLASYKNLVKKYGNTFTVWHQNLPAYSSTEAADYLLNSPVNMPLGDYATVLTEMFNTCSYNGGYGGKPWGNIADTFRKVVVGETSPEMFIDTAWTLAHNNGPMFNKGMLYDNYTHELLKILDVQRSGQIPQLIYSKGVKASTNNKVEKLFKSCQEVFPTEFSGDVNWYLVESLGAVNAYPKEKQKQALKNLSVVSKKLDTPPVAEPTNVFNIYTDEYALIVPRKVA